MMTLWVILFIVAALPIILLSLKGLFVVVTEGGKPPLPTTPGVAYGEGGMVRRWEAPAVDLDEYVRCMLDKADAEDLAKLGLHADDDGDDDLSDMLDDAPTTPPNMHGEE
jgi:hypothetical protein